MVTGVTRRESYTIMNAGDPLSMLREWQLVDMRNNQSLPLGDPVLPAVDDQALPAEDENASRRRENDPEDHHGHTGGKTSR